MGRTALPVAIRIMDSQAVDSQAVTQAAPSDESAGQIDTIVDESLKESGIVAHDADAAI